MTINANSRRILLKPPVLLALLGLVFAAGALLFLMSATPEHLAGAAPRGPAAPRRADTLVSVGSPRTPAPRNDQDEPALAVDANHPWVLAAGANDAIDNEPCTGNSCPFTQGVNVNGVYFSFDSGATWTQPTYSGWTARTGTAQFGPIGTVPWYFESGLETLGDPALAFGPRPGADGEFSWANGSRLYYATLAANFGFTRDKEPVKGFSGILVSRTDDPQTAALGGEPGKNAWKRPVLISEVQSRTTFSDKEQIWADNVESSPFFGNVYACWADFRSGFNSSAFPDPLMLSYSTDGGDTWSHRMQISEAVNNNNLVQFAGRQGCTIRTDGQGTVYVFFLAGHKGQVAQMMARSFDGGVAFERPRPVATPIFQVGAFDAFQSYEFFDGVRGARTNSFPSVDIANGAPTGLGATDQIVLTWPDAQCETAPAPPPPFTPCLNSEAALVQYSLDRGESWSSPLNMAEPGDRPDFPAIAVSPNGSDVYLVYDGFLDPWRTDMFGSRRMQGVIRHADVAADGSLVNLKTLHRGAVGDARASGISNPALRFGFLGDYNYAVATNAFGSAVWVDTRDAALCPAINAWRQSLLENPPDSPPPAPAPGTDCPRTFGNTDIFGGTFPDPTP